MPNYISAAHCQVTCGILRLLCKPDQQQFYLYAGRRLPPSTCTSRAPLFSPLVLVAMFTLPKAMRPTHSRYMSTSAQLNRDACKPFSTHTHKIATPNKQIDACEPSQINDFDFHSQFVKSRTQRSERAKNNFWCTLSIRWIQLSATMCMH